MALTVGRAPQQTLTMGSAPKGSMYGSIYWIGDDGNVYVKGAGGNGAAVTNAGKNTGSVTANLILNGAQQIKNPGNSSKQQGVAAPAPSNPNGGGGGYSAPAKVDKSNDIALQNAGLANVDGQYNAGVSAIQRALDGLNGQYDAETLTNEGSYKTSSDNNTLNLQKNKQTALVNASQGRQGLFGSLGSLGALNGDGIVLANRAVQKAANDDLSGAADNYGENQNNLETSIAGYRNEDARRRKDAQTAAENAKTNAKGDAAKSRLQFYTNLSNDYAAMGDSANANKFSSMAGAQYGDIASSNIPNSNIAYSGAAFTPGTLSNYIAGADGTEVQTTAATPGGIPGLVASPTKKKQAAAALVAA